MNYSLTILDWLAIAPGLCTTEAWTQWASLPATSEFHGAIEKSQRIPMMSARRMSIASRLAVEAGLTLLEKHQIDMAVFSSRHGELERTYKILQVLAQEQPVSPTDFSMSVHNTAAGWMTITAKNPLPVTSLAAGADSFQQAMVEARAMLAVEGINKVLLVDFDGALPDVYSDGANVQAFPYCVALVLTLGTQLDCLRVSVQGCDPLPQSLIFLRNWLLKNTKFSIGADTHQWQWQRTE
ncbi:MAG: beta-ketoacyl synthase chain length factor [Rouxiella aceris]|uniref:beta-ketoacyl synthase chain length factor n=1 Tax=Rouxiella aceris TaxID=2703884 RepID=UPI002841815C|nr:beta-ketoacyl synthase chain length factor [Rouxiella aceris]MDR3432162.1 beta-ketoacyl synthase chain length factor [Rouxiella aceris]